ncbi:MAG: DUF2934 domain-containing protein [Rhodocyclaceae bacterium]|nr:DUF2934 domain-containing protein [Rhodocyclaceae bacterium]
MKSSARKSRLRVAPSLGGAPSAGVPDRFDAIATAAYFKSEARGFTPGRELDDWLAAEAEFPEGETA